MVLTEKRGSGKGGAGKIPIFRNLRAGSPFIDGQSFRTLYFNRNQLWYQPSIEMP